ncbi:MAG: DUF3592 domain-containing protein [Magnetococcales bacterium]|nr:DUF3592 domain-containing protein [Magnetococcales bacterium]
MGRNFYLLSRNLALFMGITFLVIFIQPILKYSESSKWPQAEGTIIQSGMTKDDSFLSGLFGVYRVEVVYKFKAGDTEYQGNQIDSDPYAALFFFEQFARVTVERYPPGKTVQTYYNQNNPGESFIARTLLPGIGFFWVIGSLVIFLIAALIMVNKNPIQNAIDKTFNKSLRPNGRDPKEIFENSYPKAIYHPPAQNKGG